MRPPTLCGRRGVIPPREEVVGKLMTLTQGTMGLVDLFIRRVIVTQNPRTGNVHFTEPDDDAPFGWDQEKRYAVEQTWNEGELQEEGTRVCGGTTRRTGAVDRCLCNMAKKRRRTDTTIIV